MRDEIPLGGDDVVTFLGEKRLFRHLFHGLREDLDLLGQFLSLVLWDFLENGLFLIGVVCRWRPE
jgi:hypothetical protein